MEIERKYLVNKLPEEKKNARKTNIEQGYISHTPEKRVRHRGEKFYFTEKGLGTLARPEEESEISSEVYKAMVKRSKGNLITKDRFEIKLSEGLIAELDIFNGIFEGLILVEVEFDSITDSENFIPPSWFGEEVTYDKRFKNKNLALMDEDSIKELINPIGKRLIKEKQS